MFLKQQSISSGKGTFKSILVHLYGRKQSAMQRYLKSLQMLKKLETEEVLLDLFMPMTMSRTDNMITTLQYLNQVTGSIDPFVAYGLTKLESVMYAGTNHRKL